MLLQEAVRDLTAKSNAMQQSRASPVKSYASLVAALGNVKGKRTTELHKQSPRPEVHMQSPSSGSDTSAFSSHTPKSSTMFHSNSAPFYPKPVPLAKHFDHPNQSS